MMDTDFKWSTTGRILSWRGHSFDTSSLFHDTDKYAADELYDFFSSGMHEWGDSADTYYTRFLTEAVLSAVSDDSYTYNLAMGDATFLRDLVFRAHHARASMPVIPSPNDRGVPSYEGFPKEGPMVDMVYKRGSVVKHVDHLDLNGAYITFSPAAVCVSYGGEARSMDFVAPSDRGLMYATEAMLCARLLMRKLGAVVSASAEHVLRKLSDELAYCYLAAKEEREVMGRHFDIRPGGSAVIRLTKAPTVEDICHGTLLGKQEHGTYVNFDISADQRRVDALVEGTVASILFIPDSRVTSYSISTYGRTVLTCSAPLGNMLGPVILLFAGCELVHVEFIAGAGYCRKDLLDYECDAYITFYENKLCDIAVDFVVKQLADIGLTCSVWDTARALRELRLSHASEDTLMKALPRIVDKL